MAYEISSSIAQGTVATQNVAGSSTNARASGGHFSPDGTRLAVPVLASANGQKGIDIYTSSSASGWTQTDFCRAFEGGGERHVIGVQWRTNSELMTILSGRGFVTFESGSSGWDEGVRRMSDTTARAFTFNPSKNLIAIYTPDSGGGGQDYVDIYISGSGFYSLGYRIDNASASNKRVAAVEWLSTTDLAIGVPDFNGGFGANTDSGEVTIWRTTDSGDNFSEIEKVEGHIGDEHLGAAIYYHTASGNMIVGGGKPTSNFADNVGGYKWYLYQSSSTGGYVQGVSDRTILTETGSASGRVPAQFYMQQNDASNRFAIALAASTATGTNGQVLVWESGSAEGWKASVIDDNVTLYYPGASYASQVGLSVDGIVANNNNVTPDTGNKTFRVHTPTISAGDTTGPSITTVALSNISHTAGASTFYGQSGYLKTNTRVDITVTFDEAVTVVTTGGTPTLAINIGGVSRDAEYFGALGGGSGTANIKFKYFLTSGETTDDDGISIDAGSISLNGGTMKDDAGNNATLSYNAVAANSSYKVDTTSPTITNVVMASDNSYATVTFSENVSANAFGAAPQPSDFSLSLAGGNSAAINLNATPSSVERDTEGSQTTYKVYLNGTDLDTNATGNETLVVDSVDDEIFDRAGNAHSAAHAGVSLTDTAGPSISSISFPDSSDNTKVKIVFSERVGRSNGSLWTSSDFPDSNNTYINFSSSNPLIKNFISTFDEYQSTSVANDTIVLDIAYDGDVQSGDKLNAQFFSNATNGIYDASGNFTAGTISASSDASFPTTGRARTTFNRTFKVVNATSGSAFAYLSTDRDEGDFAFGSAVYGNRMVFLGSVNAGQTGSFTVSDEKHNDHLYSDSALDTYSLLVYNAAQDTTSFSPSSPSGAGKAQKNFKGYEFNGGILDEPHMASDRRDWKITYRQDDTASTQKSLGNWVVTKTDTSVLDYFVGRSHVKTQVSLVSQLDGTGSIRWDWGEKVRFPSHSEDGSDGFSSFRTQVATQNSHLSNNLSERIFNVSLDSSYEGDISNVRVGDLTFTTSSEGTTDGAWLLTFFYDGIANGTERVQVSYSGEPSSNQFGLYFYDSEFNSIRTVDALLDNFYTSWPIGTDRASFRIGLSQDALPTSKTETISTSGGTVKAGGTNADPTVTLTIPENAVSENTSIGINLDQDNNPRTNGVQYSSGLSGMESYSKVIEVTPHTNQFSQAVTLSFKLEGSAAGTKPSNLVIYKSLTSDGPWFKLPSHLYSCSNAGVVTLTATSFSRYHALGGNNMARTQINNAQIAKFVTPAKALARSFDLTGSLSSSAGANANKAAYLSATDLFIVHRTGSEAQPISASVMQNFFSSPDVPDAGDADNTNYKVVFSPGGNGANLLHDTELTYNPSTDLLSAGHITLNRADAAGDVAVNFAQGGTVAYAMGIDDSDSNTWKLHSAASLADSSDVSLSAAGVLTAANLVATTADINAGTVDAVIGGTNPAAGTFTTLVANTSATVGSLVVTDDQIQMTPSDSDTVTIAAATNGALNITTVDGSAGAAANLLMTIDGTAEIASQGLITLDSGAGIALEPAAGSAILLDGTISIDAGVVTGATSITSTAFVGALDGAIGQTTPAVGAFTTVTVDSDIIHAGDTDNKIAFGEDTQSFETGGSSRADLSDSGLRLGGANARVTTILDEDDMSSDSATALATQQSIKKYVDDNGGKFFVVDDQGDSVTAINSSYIKFIGSGITTNLTDTSHGSEADPFDLTLTIDAAQTGITSILATDLKIGEDDQTKIDFEDADKINFYVNNVKDLVLEENVLAPGADSEVDLGKTGARFKDAYVDSVTVTSDVVVGGNLTVQGTTTTIDTANLLVEDSLIEIARGDAGARASNAGAGLYISGSNITKDISLTAAADGGRLKVSGSTAGFDVQVGGDYAINGSSVLSADGAVKVQSGVAGAGLAHSAGVLSVDISGFSAVTPAASDSFLTLDSDGSTEQRTTTDALATLFAGAGLDASSAVMAIDISQFSEVAPAASDALLTLDSDGSTEQLTTTDALASLFAGAGLTATNAVMAVANATNGGIAVAADDIKVDIDDLSAVTTIASGDTFAMAQQGESGDPTKKITFDNMAAKLGGAGLTPTAGVLAVVNASNGGIAVAADDIKIDIDDLSAVTAIASGDTFAIAQQAESGDPTKKITFDNMAAKLAGDGLAASAGVIAVQSVQRTFHASHAQVTTGAAANFTDNYDTEIVQASFHVYLNGMLQTRSGSLDDTHTVFDYTVSGTKLQLASEMDSDDVLVVSYIKKG